MRLKDRHLLLKYMEAGDFTQARLGRYAGCSRQFIHMLISGERTTCTREIGTRIEEAMRVLPGTLFEVSMSPVRKRGESERTTARTPRSAA
jgi:hypothetical protein